MSVKFDYAKMRKSNPALYRRLLYEVATLFIKGNTHIEIATKIHDWAKTNARSYYNKDSKKDNITPVWVGRRIADARDYGFLTLGRFEENELAKAIRSDLPSAERINLVIAPDADALLRRVWLDFDEILIEKVKYSKGNDKIIVAVSGGATLLDPAKVVPSVKGLLRWYKPGEVLQVQKDKVTIFSLTSGGMRTDIAALSDTVAASIAQELDVNVRGLMGPALFTNKSARDAFMGLPVISQHIKLVEKAEIILTSVGYVGDEKSLTSRVLSSIDRAYVEKLRRENVHLADILYDCYNGFTGDSIKLPAKIKNRIFSVIGCQKLKEMVNIRYTRCIVVARGYQKGYHALRGVIVNRMASDIYMDVECAKGLVEAVGQYKRKVGILHQ